MKKPIVGTWMEVSHHSRVEGKYWDAACRNFTAEQWEAKIDELASVGMRYIVLLDTAIVYDEYSESYFETDIFPFADMACKDPMGAVLTAADRNGMKVFVSCGFYGNCYRALNNMTSPEVTERAFKAMEQLWEKYGHHESFYGWYFPDETCIAGHFHPDFMDYVNRYSAHARKIAPGTKTLIAPYGTRILVTDEEYIQQLRNLDVDIVAYQDEVGVKKTPVDRTERIFERLRKAHDKAGRAELWADIELFTFEGAVYNSALIPADFRRVKKQLENAAPYCDKILCYQYPGIMNPADSPVFAGHESSSALHNEYKKYLEEIK